MIYLHADQYAKFSDPLIAQDPRELSLVAQLDNGGANKFVPGNCLTCHGPNSVWDNMKNEVIDAFFLPFDLQHGFEYYSGTGLSRSSFSA